MRYEWNFSTWPFSEIDGVRQFIENPEYEKKLKEKELVRLELILEALEERIIEVSKKIKNLKEKT